MGGRWTVWKVGRITEIGAVADLAVGIDGMAAHREPASVMGARLGRYWRNWRHPKAGIR